MPVALVLFLLLLFAPTAQAEPPKGTTHTGVVPPSHASEKVAPSDSSSISEEARRNKKLKEEISQTEEQLVRELEKARKQFLEEVNKLLNEATALNKEASQKTQTKSPKKDVSTETAQSVQKRQEKGFRQKKGFQKIPDYLYVWPESKTFLPISRIDLNRFVCSRGKITGVFTSADKGIVTTKAGKNLFLRIVPESYAFKHPFELFLVCAENGEEETYQMILSGEDISARTIVLQSLPEKRKVAASSSPRTEKITRLVKEAYNESFSSERSVKRVLEKISPETFGLPKGIKIFKYLEVDTGEWVAELYFLSSSLPAPYRPAKENFIGDDTVAVSVFNPVIPSGGFGRVLIIREKIKSIFGG